jgi:hypothetical protein
LLPPLQLASLAGLAVLAPAVAAGTAVVWLFLAGTAVLAAWGLVGVHAWRRAARRRAALDMPTGQAGAGDLLWLAPVAIALSTALWAAGGRAASPALVVDQYLGDWAAGRVEAGIARFEVPPAAPGVVDETWEGQLGGLRNDLVRAAAEYGLEATVDPDRPFDSVRWSDGGPYDGDRGRIIVIEVVRRETVRSRLFEVLPITSQRLVPVARLGEVRLRAVPATGGLGAEWRIVRVEVGGIVLGR